MRFSEGRTIFPKPLCALCVQEKTRVGKGIAEKKEKHEGKGHWEAWHEERVFSSGPVSSMNRLRGVLGSCVFGAWSLRKRRRVYEF